jgi:hypothetical protein
MKTWGGGGLRILNLSSSWTGMASFTRQSCCRQGIKDVETRCILRFLIQSYNVIDWATDAEDSISSPFGHRWQACLSLGNICNHGGVAWPRGPRVSDVSWVELSCQGKSNGSQLRSITCNGGGWNLSVLQTCKWIFIFHCHLRIALYFWACWVWRFSTFWHS